MDVREKLFTLFQDCNNPSWKWFPNNAEMLKLIDYLIAHGVTVQEWISVKDRFPNVNTSKSGYERKGVIVIVDGCLTKSVYRIYERACNRGKTVYRWKYPWDTISDENITHWCELPQPPKGE